MNLVFAEGEFDRGDSLAALGQACQDHRGLQRRVSRVGDVSPTSTLVARKGYDACTLHVITHGEDLIPVRGRRLRAADQGTGRHVG